MRDARSEPGMTKQTTEHGKTDNRAWRNRQPGMTTHQSLPAATGNLINPTVTPTYPPVTPDLYSSHPRLIRQSSRACTAVIPDLIGDLCADSLAPGARRSP